jgi:predicted RNA-binding protein with PIN domain
MELYEQLKTLVATLEEDVTKFYEKGNKTAGTRIRKSCQEIKNLCQEIRVDVSGKKNNDTVTA